MNKLTPVFRDALFEATEIDSHIQFVREFLTRHHWSDSIQEESESILQQIQFRRTDPNLYLGVVGEFSSGKTTFINALIRDDLLKTDVIQATTSAPTMMRYSAQLDVEIEFQSGEKKSYRADGVSFWSRFVGWFKKPSFGSEKKQLRAFIHAATAEETFAQTIKMVTIYHPTDTFRQGLIIVDTPGTNAANQRHAEVAEWAVSERCDAALVIVPADVPASQSLIQFLKQAIPNFIHRCLFIVTKLDLIRNNKERERLLQTIERRLSHELSQSSVRVWGAAPQLVVDQVTGHREKESRLSENQHKELLEQFSVFESQLWQTLEAQRNLILVERLSFLMSRLFGKLTEELRRYEEAYRIRHEALLQNQIPDMGTFIKNQKQKHGQSFRKHVLHWLNDAELQADKIQTKVLEHVQMLVYQTQNKEGLRTLMEHGIAPHFQSVPYDIQQIITPILQSIPIKAQKQIKNFEKDFRQIYESLATLGGQLSGASHEYPLFQSNNIQIAIGIQTDQLKSLITESEGIEVAASFGGAGVGAAIGTFLLPGIGTAIGGAIGWIAGSFFGPSLDELKRQSMSQLEQTIRENFKNTKHDINQSINSSVDVAETQLLEEIDRYFHQYNQLVQQMIERDRQEAQTLQIYRQQIEQDQQNVSFRKKQLEQIILTLRRL